MIRNKFFEDPDGGYAKVGVKKNFDIAWKKVLAYEEQTGQSLDNDLSSKVKRTARIRDYKLYKQLFY